MKKKKYHDDSNGLEELWSIGRKLGVVKLIEAADSYVLYSLCNPEKKEAQENQNRLYKKQKRKVWFWFWVVVPREEQMARVCRVLQHSAFRFFFSEYLFIFFLLLHRRLRHSLTNT